MKELMELVDETHRAKFSGEAPKFSASALTCRISQGKSKYAIIKLIHA